MSAFPYHHLGSGVLVLGALLLAACDADPGAPQPPFGNGSGTFMVTVQTAGTNLDPNGYLVAVNGGSARRLGLLDTLRIEDLAPGDYTAVLSDVASNCTTNSDQFTLPVVNNSLTEAPFAIACL